MHLTSWELLVKFGTSYIGQSCNSLTSIIRQRACAWLIWMVCIISNSRKESDQGSILYTQSILLIARHSTIHNIFLLGRSSLYHTQVVCWSLFLDKTVNTSRRGKGCCLLMVDGKWIKVLEGVKMLSAKQVLTFDLRTFLSPLFQSSSLAMYRQLEIVFTICLPDISLL